MEFLGALKVPLCEHCVYNKKKTIQASDRCVRTNPDKKSIYLFKLTFLPNRLINSVIKSNRNIAINRIETSNYLVEILN